MSQAFLSLLGIARSLRKPMPTRPAHRLIRLDYPVAVRGEEILRPRRGLAEFCPGEPVVLLCCRAGQQGSKCRTGLQRSVGHTRSAYPQLPTHPIEPRTTLDLCAGTLRSR